MLGTQYIEHRFQQRWKGVRTNQLQALDWPRVGVLDLDGYQFDSDALPQRLKDAAAEAALRSIDDGDLDPDLQSGSGVIMTRDKVGPLETEQRFSSGGSLDTSGSLVKKYKIVDRMLQDLVEDVDLVGRG